MIRGTPGPLDESIEKTKYRDLTIFTGSLYNYLEEDYVKDPVLATQNEMRGKIALKTLENAQKLGVNVVVHDMGSCQNWLDKAQQINGVTIINDKKPDGTAFTMGGGRRKALEVAMKKFNTDYYLRTEAEKDDLITEKNLDALMGQIRTKKYDIVIPKRKDKSSYPEFQVREENRANKVLSNMMKRDSDDEIEDYDFFFGPKLMTKSGAQYLLDYNKDSAAVDLWDAHIVPPLLAHEDGKNIGSAIVDFTYNQDQKSHEELEPMIEIEKQYTNTKGEKKVGIRRREAINQKRLQQYVLMIDEAKKQLKIKKDSQKDLLNILNITPQG